MPHFDAQRPIKIRQARTIGTSSEHLRVQAFVVVGDRRLQWRGTITG
jgi:hypothetical protein